MDDKKVGYETSRTYQIDQAALNRYKKILLKRVVWSFVLLFVVIIERIFSDYAQNTENNVILWLQDGFNVTSYENISILLRIPAFLDTYRYLLMLLTSFYVTFFFGVNAVICLKIMYVHMNACMIIALLEILFGDPRPFWSDSSIIGVSCTNSYGFPSYNIFCFGFLIMYSRFCYNTDEDEEASDRPKKVMWVVLVLILVIYGFLTIINGDDYISQVILAILYCFLMYYMAVFFDKPIDNLVLKSTIQTDSAKRYSIFWMVYLIIVGAVGAIFYETSSTFLNIEWFDNYFNCLNQQGITVNSPYYHLLGPWGSFLKTSVIYILLGTVFGAAKTFRDLNGVFWYKTALRNRLLMVIIANLCLIPSWVVLVFFDSYQSSLEDAGIDEYLFYALHFTILYFILFGIVPKNVFERLGLINANSGYVAAPDDFIKVRMTALAGSLIKPSDNNNNNNNNISLQLRDQ